MGWLENATRAFLKRIEPAPQTYELRCDCGARLSGRRLPTPQKLHCSECQSRFLILPASLYPRPAEPRRAKGRVEPQTLAPPRAPEPPEMPAEATPRPARKRTRGGAAPAAAEPGPAPAGPAPASASAGQPASRAGGAQQPGAPARPRIDRLLRRLLSPVRLVLGTAAAVLLVSTWWFLHAGKLERAKQTLLRSTRLAEQALSEGMLAEAAGHYEDVVAALDLLGRREPRALATRQLALETIAAGRLAPASLFQIVEEATASLLAGTSDIWPDVFRTTYRNQWVVFDAPVERSEESGGARYTIDFPIEAAAARGALDGNLAVFERLPWTSQSTARVIVAAQLQDCRPNPGDQVGWIITFRADTAFLWTRAETYQLLGLEPDEATLALLDAQRQLAESVR